MCISNFISLCIITLMLLGCRTQEDHLIIPGERVGKLVISHTNASEVGINGSISDEFNHQRLGVSFDRNGKVASVSVFLPNYWTREGLKVGASEADVIAKYGKPERGGIPIMAGTVQKGMLSDNVLNYKGISWVIENKHVTIIIVSSE